MADVRLTATNPVDSSVVPVAANSKGELLVAEPTVSEINNDVTINGDLTVTGTINGESGGGGSGLPEPYGPEGSVLTIQNGEPAWVMPPTDPVPEAYIKTPTYDASGNTGMFSDAGDIQPEGTVWDTFIKSQNCFTTPNLNNVAGAAQLTGNQCAVQLSINNGLSYILEVDWVARCKNISGGATQRLTYRALDPGNNLSVINENFTWDVPSTDQEEGHLMTVQYFVQRDTIDEVSLQFQVSGSIHSFLRPGAICCQGWRLVEPSRFVVKKLLQEAQASQEA